MPPTLSEIHKKALYESEFYRISESGFRQENESAKFIERELLHPEILSVITNSFADDLVTFQGGTALRLCYGNPRLSEDLDFAVPSSFSDLRGLSEDLTAHFSSLYGSASSFKLPPEKSWQANSDSMNIARWFAKFTMIPGRRDLPIQRVKIEMANIPIYTRLEKEIFHNYENMEGFAKPTVYVESMEEICADKLLSFSMSDYTRWRDLWDIN